MTGTEEQAKAFLFGLIDVYPDQSSAVVAESKIRVKVPVKTILGGVPAKKGNIMVTLQYVIRTGNTQVWTAAAVEDEIRAQLVTLEKAYVGWQSAPLNNKPKVEVKSPATQFFRIKAEKAIKKQAGLPTEEEYAEAMDQIQEFITASLDPFPGIGRVSTPNQ